MTSSSPLAVIQKKLGLKTNGELDSPTLVKLGEVVDLYVESFPSFERDGEVLSGDGTWPFTARVDGGDIVVENVLATCFGGNDDPNDSGETASGISTRDNPAIQGVSVPMDGRQYPKAHAEAHKALDGSPLPRMPWHTMVEIQGNGKVFRPNQGIIDIGPGKQATRSGELPNAIDLTVAAARVLNPKATAKNFSMVVTYRIIGGAKYIQ